MCVSVYIDRLQEKGKKEQNDLASEWFFYKHHYDRAFAPRFMSLPLHSLSSPADSALPSRPSRDAAPPRSCCCRPPLKPGLAARSRGSASFLPEQRSHAAAKPSVVGCREPPLPPRRSRATLESREGAKERERDQHESQSKGWTAEIVKIVPSSFTGSGSSILM